jgi:hypothetical protein
MALASLGWIDLSELTDFIVRKLDDAVQTGPLHGTSGPLPITVSGSAPDAVRSDGDCQLSVYLFHIAEDRHQRNAHMPPVARSRAQPIPFQPMALELHYLVSAYAKTKDNSFILEQQAMSIALRFFYEHPILMTSHLFPRQLTITMQSESSEELGRLWQSFAVAGRLAVVYRVAVVFMDPQEAQAPAKKVGDYTVVADPEATPLDVAPKITGPAAGASNILQIANGVFTVNGTGFVSHATEVLIGTIALTEVEAPPAQGQFRVVSETEIQFLPPATLPTAVYPVRIRTHHLEAEPAWRISV